MPLKDVKQEIFAQQILLKRNQSEAYRETYPNSRKWKSAAVHVKACNLSKKVRLRVQWLLSQSADRSVATGQKVLDRLWQIADVRFEDYATILRGKIRFKPFDEMSPAARAAMDGNGRPYNALKALEMLGRHYGIFETDNSQGPKVDGLQKLLVEIDRNAN